ncbi:MAG: translation initiation factor eIF-2B [Candidatus Aenigmatarchaeota archaeon]
MDFVQRVRDLKIQGATNIAIESLKHLKKFARKNGFGPKFDNECKRLLNARPTAVVLYNVIEELKIGKSLRKIDELLKRLGEVDKKIDKYGVKIFRNSGVMNHCHSTEVVSLMKFARKKIKYAIVTETRPKNQGVKTANELSDAGINVVFIVDSAIGYFMPDADFVLVGADAIRKEGVVNKIGTLPMAMVARKFNKPVYVVASTFKIDRRKNFEIEIRKGSEIQRTKGIEINPAFDITPWKYISGVITEYGIKKPKEMRTL